MRGRMTVGGEVAVCVDMDGTLVLSDLGVESVFALLRRNPLYLLLLPWWLRRGLAAFKREIARRVELDVTRLPYDARVLAWLRGQDARPRLLCTASDARLAEAVARHLGGFDAVLASDGRVNLAGARKAAALVARCGERGFDYAGNARADLKVWAHARNAIVVNAPAPVLRAAQAQGRVARVFAREHAPWRECWRALRPHQWAKNLLVFVAPLAAHRLDAGTVAHALVAFAAFCLCASAAYVLNDLLDLEADRQHPRKRERVFAAGRLSPLAGLWLVPLLLLAALAWASLLGQGFVLVLLGYGLTTLMYSLWFKRLPALDVVVLALLYTLRIVAGGVAIPVEVSGWLLAFALCLFLGLALLKREIEFARVPAAGDSRLGGRGYRHRQRALLRGCGIAAGSAAVVVLALYVDSTKSAALYTHPDRLWGLVALLALWLARLWQLATRGRMHDDPLVYALRDRGSRWLLGVLLVLFGIAAVVHVPR